MGTNPLLVLVQCILFVIILSVSYNLICPLIIDYRFSREGINVILFRRWCVFCIERKDIKRAYIPRNSLDRKLFRFVVCFKNRHLFVAHYVVIETTGFVDYILTPVNLKAALNSLGAPRGYWE